MRIRLEPFFIALVSVLVLVAPHPVLAGPLPRLAVTLAAGIDAGDAARTLASIGASDIVLVLPAVSAPVGGNASTSADLHQQSLPAGGHFWAHVRVRLQGAEILRPGQEEAIERQMADLVGQLCLGRPGIEGLVIETARAETGVEAGVLQFAVAALSTQARSVRPSLMLTLVMPGDGAQAPGRSLAYVDALVVPEGDTLAGGAVAGKAVVRRGAPQPSAVSAWLETLLALRGAPATFVWLEAPTLPALRSIGTSAQSLGRSLAGGFEMTAADRAPVAVTVDGAPALSAVAFVGSQSADVGVLLKAGGTRQTPRSLGVVVPSATPPPQVTCMDASDGHRLDTRLAAGRSECRADGEYVLIVARVASGQDRVFESVNVTASATLRVEEIIARWQAVREAERRALDNYTVPVFMNLHFESAGMTSGVDVALELRQYVDRAGIQDWVQTAFRVNGVKLRRGQEFPLPQIEPDKVLTKPLDLRMDEKYVYELEGTDTVNGHLCYVVGIRPGSSGETLYRGRAWIDGMTFTQVRLRLEQQSGGGTVASHVETQEFETVGGPEGQPFTLVRTILAEDSVTVAGRPVLVEKRYAFGEYLLNAPDFAAAVAAARSGDNPMFRETDAGLRALRKDNRSGQRVVETSVNKRIRALAAGVMYSGFSSVPVPLAGISWMDFDFRGTGTQLSALFAGPLFAANLSGPVTKKLRWGVDVALSALPRLYREYSVQGERKDRQVRDYSQMVGGLLNWQTTTDLVLSSQIDLYWDAFSSTGNTAPAYRLPARGVTLGFYEQAKYTHRGFNATATGEHGRRAGWQTFGYPTGDTDPFHPNWTRYSLEISQHAYVGKLTRAGISAGYFGGHHLDRFSRYSPSFLSRPKLSGIPSGVATFDEVRTLGGYYGFNVMDAAKLEGSYTHAWTLNRSEQAGWRQLDGVELGMGIAGPLGTFVQGTFSLALRGDLDRYPTRWGCYLMILKPMKKM